MQNLIIQQSIMSRTRLLSCVLLLCVEYLDQGVASSDVAASHNSLTCMGRDPSTGSETFREYNPRSEICCAGSVHHLDKGHLYNFACCGSNVYNLFNHECCGGEILAIYSTIRCCGKQLAYNSSTHICCNGHLHEKYDTSEACCGNYPYNLQLQTCCYGNLGQFNLLNGQGECCGAEIYNPDTQTCCHSWDVDLSKVHSLTDQEHQYCCSSEIIDDRSEICCEGLKYPQKDGIECCGSSTYNITSEICCGRSVKPIADGKTECCGATSYNPNHQTCCYDALFDIAHGDCCLSQAYQPLEASCCDEVINSQIPEVQGVTQCCNGQSYLNIDQLCCNGHLHMKEQGFTCCGHEIHNATSHICCGNYLHSSVVPKISEHTACCKLQAFDPTWQTCCSFSSTVHPVASGDCCIMEDGREAAFDPEEGVCCRGESKEVFYGGISSLNAQCCGSYILEENQLCDWLNLFPVMRLDKNHTHVCSRGDGYNALTYNPVNEICTYSGEVVPFTSRQAICGNYLIDIETEICCGDFVIHSRFDSEGNERQCCYDSLLTYSPSFEMCCLGQVFNIPESSGRCCGNKAFNPATHLCDESLYIKTIKEALRFPHRCGGIPYYKKEHTCCGGNSLIGLGQSCCDGMVHFTGADGINGGKCCRNLGYNPDSHVCCGNKVHLKPDDGSICCGADLFRKDNPRIICCNGTLDLTSGGRTTCIGSTAYNSDEETVCDGVIHNIPNAVCCGREIFKEETQLCCNKHVITKTSESSKCCGTQGYDSSDLDLLCCGSTLHQIEGQERVCCGERSIDDMQQICCRADHSAFTYTKQPNHLCCGAIMYNASRHSCCNGALNEFSVGGVCCGDEPLQRNQGCCNGLIYNQKHCCAGSIYNPNDQTCCGDVLYDIPNGSCCGNRQHPYDLKEKMCCEGKVRYKKNGQNACCGRYAYHQKREICCDGVIHSSEEAAQCCGVATFKPWKQVCCNGSKIMPYGLECQGQSFSSGDSSQEKSKKVGVSSEVSREESEPSCPWCLSPSTVTPDISNLISINKLIFKAQVLNITMKGTHTLTRVRVSGVIKGSGRDLVEDGILVIQLPGTCHCQVIHRKRPILVFTNSPIHDAALVSSSDDLITSCARKVERKLSKAFNFQESFGGLIDKI